MDRLIANNTVPFGSHDTAPTTGTPGLAREANPALSIPGTEFPAYAWNMLEEEIRNALLAAGITPDTANWMQLAQAISNLGHRYQSFTTSGTFVVPTGVTRIRVRLWGGGGGGGGALNTGCAAIGGSGGGYAEGSYVVAPGATLVVTVGAGGAGGVPGGGNGSNGGLSSVASLLSATGGGGGGGASSGIQTIGTGAAGIGVGRNAINLTGLPGQVGFITGNTSLLVGGGGGATAFFATLTGSVSAAGNSAGFAGCGGGGASAAAAGGFGSAGLVMIEY